MLDAYSLRLSLMQKLEQKKLEKLTLIVMKKKTLEEEVVSEDQESQEEVKEAVLKEAAEMAREAAEEVDFSKIHLKELNE